MFHTESLSEREFDLILSVLRAGDVIGFPTDTCYGLAANPFNAEAIAKIFSLKGRPESKPILLLVDSLAMAEEITQPNSQLRGVAAAFWPGPLTVVLNAASNIPEMVIAGTGTVGLRWPLAPFATELVRRFGGPITGTSANRSGSLSCVTADEVRSQLSSLPLLVDGGQLPARSGSTLLDLTTDPPELLREGPVAFDALRDFFEGNVRRRVE